MRFSKKIRKNDSVVTIAIAIALGLGFVVSATGTANAAQFDFGYSFQTYDLADFPSGYTSASGIITATNEGSGVFLATSITGTWNGENITGLLPLGYPGNPEDNLLFPGSYPVIDSNGVDFSVAGPIEGDIGQGYVLLYYQPGVGYTDDSNETGFSPNFTLTQVSGAPEPATWVTMLSGFGCLGIALRSRRKQALAA